MSGLAFVPRHFLSAYGLQLTICYNCTNMKLEALKHDFHEEFFELTSYCSKIVLYILYGYAYLLPKTGGNTYEHARP